MGCASSKEKKLVNHKMRLYEINLTFEMHDNFPYLQKV